MAKRDDWHENQFYTDALAFAAFLIVGVLLGFMIGVWIMGIL